MNDQTVASAPGTLRGAEQRVQWGQIKSRQVWRHFCSVSKCRHGGNTHTLLKLLLLKHSSVLPPLTPAAYPLLHPQALADSMSFLFSLLIPPPLVSFPPNHTSLIYALSLPGSPSLLSPLTLPHPPFSLYCSVSSSILILINPPFPFPAPSSSLSCRTSLAGPSVEWSYCSLSLSLPLSLGQHFRDLLIGLELSIPTGWIAEHRCKSALA